MHVGLLVLGAGCIGQPILNLILESGIVNLFLPSCQGWGYGGCGKKLHMYDIDWLKCMLF